MDDSSERLDKYFRDELLNDFRDAVGRGDDYSSVFTDCLKSILTRKSEARVGGVYISPLEIACVPFLMAVGLLEEKQVNESKAYFFTDKAKKLIEED